jgi:hypothetical protein
MTGWSTVQGVLRTVFLSFLVLRLTLKWVQAKPPKPLKDGGGGGEGGGGEGGEGEGGEGGGGGVEGGGEEGGGGEEEERTTDYISKTILLQDKTANWL